MKFNPLNRLFRSLVILLIFCVYSVLSVAQSDLRSLLDQAEKKYPSIAARKAISETAKSRVSLEENKLLPSLDAAYQINYATYSNIAGLDFPGAIVPVSGPPTSTGITAVVPGTAISLTGKWSPFTFGQRSASVAAAKNQYEKELAGIQDEILKIKFRVAYAFLEIASTQELIKAYEKNNERNEFSMKQVRTLVSAGIRPAVDSLKFRGELSKTRSELIRLMNQLEIQKQELTELLASSELQNIEKVDFFFGHLPVFPGSESSREGNPVLKMAQYDLEANKDKYREIKLSWVPKLELWGTTFARGSGVNYDGTLNKANGWSFSRYNYGLGVQLIFPILNISNVQILKHQQNAYLKASESNLMQLQLDLNKQQNVAFHDLSSSLQIAREIPLEYQANEAAYKAILTRYNSGIVDYSELIQSQYDLLNAEARLKTAYTNSWKSLLSIAVTTGDLGIFLNQIP